MTTHKHETKKDPQRNIGRSRTQRRTDHRTNEGTQRGAGTQGGAGTLAQEAQKRMNVWARDGAEMVSMLPHPTGVSVSPKFLLLRALGCMTHYAAANGLVLEFTIQDK